MASLVRRYLDWLYFDMVEKRLAAQLEYVQTQSVDFFLDLGCHVGYNTDRTRQVLCPKYTLGIEFALDSILEAHKRGFDVIRHDLNLMLPLASNVVNVVTAFDVLEHLVETWQFVVEVYRVLAPGGMLLLDCPNLASWHNVFALILGLQPFSGPHLTSLTDSDLEIVQDMHRRDHDLAEGQSAEALAASKMHRHIVVPAYHSLCRLLRRAGFEIENSWGFGYYPFPPPLADWLCKIDIGHSHHYIIQARKPIEFDTRLSGA